MKILKYVCEYCTTEAENDEGLCSNCGKLHSIKPVQDLPDGTMVRISKKALKSYYMTELCVDGYMIGKVENGNMDFMDFFRSYRFNSGLDCGIVTGYGADIFYTKVKYFDAIGEWKETYVSNWDLEIV